MASNVTDVEQFFKDNEWLPPVIGSVGGLAIIIIIVIVVIVICRYRRSRRRQYMPIQGEISVFRALELQRQTQKESEKESTRFNCRFYLRSSLRYSMVDTIPDIGSRMDRSWFIIKQDNPPLTDLLLLTVTPQHSKCPVDFSKDKKALNQLFFSLQHPFIHPVIEVDYIIDRSLVVVIAPLNARGSMKDLLHRTRPFTMWSSKYNRMGNPLPSKQVALFGRQILEAAVYLHDKGLSPLGHIQSGNVLMHSATVCRLTGYENSLLGYKPRIYSTIKSLLKEDKNAIDVLMFGHLIFEMSTGRECELAMPEPHDLSMIRHSAIVEVLSRIFTATEDDGKYITLQEVLDMPFFQQQTPPELTSWNMPQIPLSAEVKTLLQNAKTTSGSNTTGRESRRSRRYRKSMTSDTQEKYPISRIVSTSAVPTVSQPPAKSSASDPSIIARSAPPTVQPPQPVTPPTSKKEAPKSTKDRGALLSDIRRGTSLKKGVTNDRSAPKLS